MCQDSAFLNSAFSSRDTLQEGQPAFQFVIGLNVHQVSGGPPVLSNEDRLIVAFEFKYDLRGLPFKRGHQLRSHKSDTKVALPRQQQQSFR
jgi:hypothetical protein